MKKYTNFFGIDVAKNEFVVALYGKKRTLTYANDANGIERFIGDHKGVLEESLITLETTGGYEMNLLISLVQNNYTVHRADTVKAKNFMRSLRRYGKTDDIDALALATYAFERQSILKPFVLTSQANEKLRLLITNRDKLVKTKVQLSNRAQSPLNTKLEKKFEKILEALHEVINDLEKEATDIIEADPELQEMKKIMMSTVGIGEKTAHKLLATMPEIGLLSRRGAASLASLAPHPYDSGNSKGYRKTRGGRENIKRALFMVALTASRTEGKLGDFYRSLIGRGKPKMVALIALMRKMIVILNAKIRDYLKTKESPLVQAYA